MYWTVTTFKIICIAVIIPCFKGEILSLVFGRNGFTWSSITFFISSEKAPTFISEWRIYFIKLEFTISDFDISLHRRFNSQTAPYRVMEFSRRIVNRTQIATKPGAGKKSKSGPSCACTKEATALLLKKAQPSLWA